MKRLAVALLACAAFASDAAEKSYALVAAMGDQLMTTHEVRGTGSHLPSYRRTGIDAPDNVLNKLVLAGLEEAIGKTDPASQRIHLAVSVRRGRTDSTPIDTAALAAVVEYLREMPERNGWDRIVVATPAFRTLRTDAMAARSQGFGVFMQPLCQSMQGPCGMFTDGSGSSAAEPVTTPDGREIKANQFVAPYVFLKIWILDPKTLEVVDSQEIFEYQKMWDPNADTMDLGNVISKRVLATRIVELTGKATEEAVRRTELRGNVEVKERGEVKDGAK